MHKVALMIGLMAVAGCGGEAPGEVPGEGDASPGVSDEVVATGGMAVTLSEGFVRPAVAGSPATAAYVTITTDRLDRLVGAEAEGFASVELHTVLEEDGVSRMRPVDGFDVIPGRLTVLRPGGDHLMLMRPEGAIEEGDTVPVTLLFDSGARAEVSLPVTRPAP